jgi:hypothetical protein
MVEEIKLGKQIGLDDDLRVRATFEARSDITSVGWQPGETKGNSTIIITFMNGETQVLHEGADYYIDKDGKACFCNNVRTMLEAAGATVEYEKTPGGGSTIKVSKDGVAVGVLVEGTDYLIGQDGKAHFTNNTEAMLNRLINDKKLGLSAIKMNTIVGIGRAMLNKEYPPAFVAGMLANIIHEGSAGLFESSAYKSNKPQYLQYMDDMYDYRNNYSGKNVVDMRISVLYELTQKLEKDNWQRGKFGLGCVQWTVGRTKALVEVYKEVAGAGDKLTFEQMLYAEGSMISREFAGAYKSIYSKWLINNAGNLSSADAACNAGQTICKQYEVPADYANKAITRGDTARNVYKMMMGS